MKKALRHVSASEILLLHDRIISLYGGLPGCPDEGRIDAVIGRVLHFAIYNDISDACSLAAMYCTAIARAHAFNDGNKRTAIDAALLVARRNGLFFAYRRDMIDVVVRVAQAEMTLVELVRYFQSLERFSSD